MLEIPFDEQILEEDEFWKDVLLSIYMRKPGIPWNQLDKDAQYLYGRILIEKKKAIEQDASTAYIRAHVIRDLLKLAVIYYDEGYTRFYTFPNPVPYKDGLDKELRTIINKAQRSVFS